MGVVTSEQTFRHHGVWLNPYVPEPDFRIDSGSRLPEFLLTTRPSRGNLRLHAGCREEFGTLKKKEKRGSAMLPAGK